MRIDGVWLLAVKPDVVEFLDGRGTVLNQWNMPLNDFIINEVHHVKWNRNKGEMNLQFENAVSCELFPSERKVKCGQD